MERNPAGDRPSLLLLLLEIVLVLPSLVFLAAAAARSLCGRGPVRTLCDSVMETAAHIPHIAVMVLFLLMPFAALAMGGAFLMRAWGVDGSLHEDARVASDLIRRRLLVLLLVAVTLLAGLILVVVVGHMVTD